MAATVVMGVLAGCASGTTDGGSQGAGEPKSGGTLRALNLGPVACLAPHGSSSWQDGYIRTQIFDQLTYQDPETGEISPWLASSWTVSADATQYTFEIRDGVTFSDGSALTAEVVRDNLDELGKGDPAKGIPASNQLANYGEATVTGPNEVLVTLTGPSAGFLQALSTSRQGIVGEATLALTGDERCASGDKVITSGPFTFASSQQDSEIVVVRRDDYNWGPEKLGHTGPAYLDKIVYTTVAESSVRVGSLLAGQADAAIFILPTDHEIVDSANGYHLDSNDVGSVQQLTINPDTPGLDDVRVRQALIAATDRDALIDTILNDRYQVANSFLGSRNPGYVDLSGKLEYDPDRAAALLDEAGWILGTDGIRAKAGKQLVVPAYISPTQVTAKPLMEYLQNEWRKLGIVLDLKAADTATYAKVTKDPSVNAFNQTSPTGLTPATLRRAWHSSFTNIVNHTYPELDALLTEQDAAVDPAEQDRLIAAASNFIADNALSIPLYEDKLVYGVSDQVHGAGVDAQGRALYVTAWLDN
nr:ABC transporter substrate-binding protein [Rhodococcus sp. 06-621-2]